jgi:hypothetical protein
MNARKSISRWGLGLIILCVALSGCSGILRYSPKGTPRAPEADAMIEADVNEASALTHLSIKTEHLAPPDRLTPGGTTYIVWARKDDSSQWARVGSLKYNPDTRKGELVEVSVPQTSFDLIISIEKQPEPASPSADVVFSQKVGGR